MDARTLMLDAMPQLQSVDLGERAMLEYAQALQDTAGGSTLAPPAVLRVLASKACRRAIMFGDTLSVPQCQALLEELAHCEQPLQCAHGRPTIASLVDLAALRLPERMEGDL
jgi:DNA mismatch repair protein MLH3